MPRPVTELFSDFRLRPGRHGIPREQVCANQRWRLLGACAQLIAESGYENLTVRALVASAAVSKATFYEQFAGVADCVTATYRMASENALAVTREACRSASDPAAALPAAVAAALELLAEEPCFAHVLTDAALDDVEGLYPLRAAFAETCAAMLASTGGPATAAQYRLSLHRVRATKGWIWERLYAGTASALPGRAPELVQLLAA